MSKLCLAHTVKRIQKYIGILGLALFLIITIFPGPAAAGGAGDVVTEVANKNLSSPEFVFGAEPVPGGKFNFYEALEGRDGSWRYVSVAEPVGGANMQAVLDFEKKQLEDEIDLNIIGTTSLQGYDLFKYTASDTVGVWLILPDYFIKAEIFESGNDVDTDFQIVKDLAQQVLYGLIQKGLVNQPDGQNGQEKPTAEGKKAPDAAAAVTGKPLKEPVEVANTFNIYAVDNGPTAPATLTVNSPHLVTYINNYHWNYAKGSKPGTIGLKGQDGKIYGPWQATGKPGQGGVPNAYWEVFPNIVIPAGTYTVTDSEPSTWSRNDKSGGRGMCLVKATPHFEAAVVPVKGTTKGGPGSGAWVESPAGVGSVGNIPGPSNTTEALVGVAVPGLIATVLGALSGLGGGGGGFPPPAGIPISPSAGGPAPAAGGSFPGAGAQSNAFVQEVGQLGRRRRGTDPVPAAAEPARPAPGAANLGMTTGELQTGQDTGGEPGIIIDPVDMVDGPGAITTGSQGTPSDKDIFIETAEESPVLTQPDTGLIIETAEESEVLIPADPKASIDPAGEEAVLVQDDRAIQQDPTGPDGTEDGILIDTSAFDEPEFNAEGYDRSGYNKEGYDKEGFNKEGLDKEGFDKAGFNQEGFNRKGFDKQGYDRDGYSRDGFNKHGFDRDGYNKAGFDKEGFDKEGFNEAGFNKEGFNKEGFNKEGFNKEGFNRRGFNKQGFDKEGFNKEGYDKEGFDREGYARNGFDRRGYDREGYDANGYDQKGYNRGGYDARGFDKQGYDKDGFNKKGWDRDGYDRNGLNKDGFDREGYDSTGYDQDGYDREGFDRQGRQREGYDEYGYNKDGFNKDGFDRDGYDREGFNYEGYSRGGYDPWGYNRQGYDRDGYHWSGYNADGYNRNGRHWSENPYEGDGNPFNVATQDPFGEGEVIPFGTTWKPTKPPLGEPYPKTLEKYGAKPWTDDLPKAEKPAAPATGDSGIIGPEDPMNTLKNHGIEKDAPAAPEGIDSTAVPSSEREMRGIPGFPRDGEKRILVGKTDGRSIEIEYNGKTGEWINIESGNPIDPEKFEKWQEDLAEDWRRSAEEMKKMSQRQDAASKAIDQNLSDWKRLDQMQKVADKYNIGEKGGPGDVDKAIQELKNDMLKGKEIDRDKIERINRVIDRRIKGETAADTGERWVEEPWYKDINSALKANAEMAREVVTGEDSEGNISVLGMTARIMITAATGAGAAQVAMDGALTVAEAIYRVKQSIDQGESDFRAVSKAIGMVILQEEIGRMAGAAGDKISREMLERYPVLVNKAADFVEEALLKVSKANQAGSAAIGLISKESAEQAIKNIEKQIAELGSEMGEEGLEKAAKNLISKTTGSADDAASAAARAATGGSDDLAAAAGKRASSSADDAAGKMVKTTSGNADDAAAAAGKTTGKNADGGGKTGKAAPASADDVVKPGKATPEQSINRGGRSAGEVINDPAAIKKAEEKLQQTIKDFDQLPTSKQQDLIKEQSIYDEYRIQAEEKTWNIADKVQRGEKLSVEDALEMKADPASMRTLKKMENVDGLGAELGTGGARKVQTEFNNVLNEKVYQPSYKDVRNHLSGKYNGAEIRVETVRTPGREYHPWDVNTDNDIIALRKVVNKDGTVEWVEIPRGEWEDIYYKSYVQNTGFNPAAASRKFPDENWSRMSDTEQARRWAELHGESPTDVFHPEAARDFSTQRSAMTGGERPLRPGAARAADGEGRLIDSEGLGLMEEYKVKHYWEQGDLRSQTEALEQLKKTGEQARNLEQGYKEMGYKITDMPDNMKKALQVVEDGKLAPAARAARLQELGYDSPVDLADKIASRIGALRAARR